MTAPDGFVEWQALMARVVDDVDPGWISGADPALLTALRASRHGRRVLARHLDACVAPALMSPAGVSAIPLLPDCDWLLAAGHDLRSRIADLGTLALAPGLRKLVDRNAVRRLRQLLTPARYAWLLTCDPDIDSSISDVHQLKGWRIVDRTLDDDAAFVQHILARGLNEIGGALHGAPRLLRDRIRLLYPPEQFCTGVDAWLPPGRAFRLLNRGGSDAAVPGSADVVPLPAAEAVG